MFHHIWNQTNIKYKNANWTWSEKELVEELVSGGGDESAIAGWQQKYPKKKKKVIRMLCKIKGKKFDESKDYKDIKLTVKDVQLLAKEVLGIELNIQIVK